MALLDLLGYGSNQPRVDQLDPSQFGAEVGLLDPITLARMQQLTTGKAGSEGNPLARLPPVPPSNLPFSQSPYTDIATATSVPPPGVEPAPPGAPVRGMVRAPSPPNVPGPARVNAGGPSIAPGLLTRTPQGGWSPTLPPTVPRGGGMSPEFGGPPLPGPTPVRAVPGQQISGAVEDPALTQGPIGASPLPPARTIPSSSPTPTTPPPPSPPTAASQSPNHWDRFGDFLSKNSNLFLGLAQMAGGRSLGEGIALAASGISQGAQLDRAKNAIALTKQTLMAKGYSEEEADAIANNPSMAKNVFENLYPQAPKPQYAVTSEDPLTGAKTHGWVLPPQYIRPRIGAVQQSPYGPRYYRNGAQGEGWYTEPS